MSQPADRYESELVNWYARMTTEEFARTTPLSETEKKYYAWEAERRSGNASKQADPSRNPPCQPG